MRIIADRDIPQAKSAFAAFGDVELAPGRSLTREQLGEAEILLVRSVTRVDRKLLEGTNIRLVGTATSGIDHLDIDYLLGQGIPYFDAAGCNARAVAEYVLACTLLHATQRPRASSSIQAGIIGYGHVGKVVHSMLSAMGVDCVLNDPPLAASAQDERFVELDEALESDIVTLHVPLTQAGDFPTHGLIGTAELRRLRPEALLINAARGGVIDETALVEWIKGREHAAAVIDCWVGEPLVQLPLLRLATLATPHIAGHTIEARLRATMLLVSKLAASLGTEANWSPRHEAPLDLRLPAAGSSPLSKAVLHCCDPRVPTAMMRKLLGLPRERRAVRFDELRQQAAARREFTAYRIASEGRQSDTVRTLCELGFDTTSDDMENDPR